MCSPHPFNALLGCTALPAQEDEPFDAVVDDDDVARLDPGEASIQEDTELDDFHIPNLPESEAKRRQAWKALPQRVRVAIRRLHRQFGHCPLCKIAKRG